MLEDRMIIGTLHKVAAVLRQHDMRGPVLSRLKKCVPFRSVGCIEQGGIALRGELKVVDRNPFSDLVRDLPRHTAFDEIVARVGRSAMERRLKVPFEEVGPRDAFAVQNGFGHTIERPPLIVI